MSARRTNTVVSVIVLLALLIQPLTSGAAAPQPAPAKSRALAPDQPGQGFLFRASVTLEGSRNLARLEKAGVLVLRTLDVSGKQTALVLVDGEQLADLARLGFRPEAADELRLLVSAQGLEKRWLAGGLQPLLAQADAVVEQQATVGVAGAAAAPDAVALQALRTSVQALTLEQLAGVAGSASVDDDADGLTNTQEAWWCTDPLNPDTDADGRSDGAEIQALKDWMANRRAGPPGETPWPSWPFNATTCPDKDHDSIPNLAERWELGLNMDLESSDRDKFDDGQELFGVTYCPGGDLSCGYGDLPRSSDSGYVGAVMPAWVKAPGNHPLVAAFPVPEVDVVESSLRVQTVMIVTTDHVIASGTEKSYSTAKTEGTSTSLANTESWQEWQEVSEALQQHVAAVTFLNPQLHAAAPQGVKIGKAIIGTGQILGGVGGAIGGCTVGSVGIAGSFGALAIPGAALCAAGIAGGVASVLQGWTDLKEAFTPDEAQQIAQPNVYVPLDIRLQNNIDVENQVILDQSMDTENLIRAIDGTRYTYAQTGELLSQRLYEMATVLATPVRTTTTAQGKSWGGSRTTTNTAYEEHTITNGEAFSSEESWGTATAVDSSRAADLWFTYKVRNSGTEYAREIANLAFNIYIGDDPNPAYTYFVGPDLGGDGKFRNFMPNEEHTYTARHIPLTLSQMRDVDLGGPIRIVVEDFTYGVDELFYQDAANAGVLIAIEDGTADGDEAIDPYLIPTWGSETVLDVLDRYFPHDTDADGMMVAVWTPEYRADTPTWCADPKIVGTGGQRTLWCKHALSTADWWNVYTNGMGDGAEGFHDTSASPGSVALFRFNQDSDRDGYSDRSEERLGTDPTDPSSFPRPDLIAGLHSIKSGSQVVSTLSLLNTGIYDAYGVEAVMIAPDDSVSVTNNTVGGSGRVKAGRQVIVGSRILPAAYSGSTWSGSAKPSSSGYYTGTQDLTYTFAAQCSNPAGCDVGSGTLNLAWNDGAGGSGVLNFGGGYASPTPLAVGAAGVKVALLSGKVYGGNSFTVQARPPADTFQYTINREPHTDPVVVVSYNDPQGNHRFVTPINLTLPTDNLITHSGKMLHGGAGVEIVTSAPFTPTQTNTTDLIVQAPPSTRMVGGHVFLEFIDPSGTVVREEAVTSDLEPGPNLVAITWNPADFNPAYDPAQDYIVMAFFTDWQGNIVGTAARPLSSFQADPKPALAFDEAGATWNFGAVAQGTVLSHTFTLANTGLMNLKATVVGTGARADQTIPGQPAWTDTGLDVTTGDALGIRACGQVCYGGNGTTLCYGPDGNGTVAPTGWAAPGAAQVSLLARIGDGVPFFVGTTYVGTTSIAGRLYLGTNDCTGCYVDNGGSYQAHIEIQGLPTALGSRPSLSIEPAGAIGLGITLDSYYLPAGTFDRSVRVRTSDPDHPTQDFRVQGTVQPYVAPAQSLAVSPYRPWDLKVAVSGDQAYRNLVTFNGTKVKSTPHALAVVQAVSSSARTTVR